MLRLGTFIRMKAEVSLTTLSLTQAVMGKHRWGGSRKDREREQYISEMCGET